MYCWKEIPERSSPGGEGVSPSQNGDHSSGLVAMNRAKPCLSA